MPLNHRRWPNAVRPLLVALAAVGLAGCANDRDQRLSQIKDPRRDPLLHNEKIPNPNLPTGRDTLANDRRDPLLRADARDDDPLFKSPDRRPTGGVTGRELTLGSSATPEQMTTELQKAGVKVGVPARTDTGGYEVRVDVPATNGARSGYVGGGSTPTAAIKDAYDQVRAGWR